MTESRVKKFFAFNLVVMRILGFYPPSRGKNIYKIYAYAVYIFCTIPVPVLAAVHLAIGEDVGLAEVGENSFIIFQAGLLIFKFIPFIFTPEKIRRNIYMLEWKMFQNSTEYHGVTEECSTACRRISMLYLFFCALASCTWAVAPFFGSRQVFPTEIWLPFDAKSETKTYVATYLFIVIGITNDALCTGALDPLVSGLAYFATSQLRILKTILQTLDELAEREIASSPLIGTNHIQRQMKKNSIIYDKIIGCINHHNSIVTFIQNYESVYSFVAFTQFIAAVVVICVSCLQLSMIKPFSFVFFSMVSFLITMLLEIFLYCYFGSTLIEESNSLTSAIYMGKWYNYDLKCQKALIILMQRSTRPMVVTAGKVLDLSLATFTMILRRAYSLLAVLKNYQ